MTAVAAPAPTRASATPATPAALPTYRDLKVWQKGVELAVETRRLAKRLPKLERDGLAAQLLEAASTVPAKIAFGHGSGDRELYAECLADARMALTETETLLEVALQLGHFQEPDLAASRELCDHTRRMLIVLARRIDPATRSERPVANG